MLALLLSTCIVCPAPQGPVPALAAAVAVRGEAELDPAAALASAEARVEEHVLTRWRERAARTVELQRPFWMPEVLTDRAVQRWLSDLPVAKVVERVDREDRERVHEFGNSYQTTLWIAEKPEMVERGERVLRRELRSLERQTAFKAGGVAAGWVGLALLLGWIDRLSRGYMTGRLRLIGLLGGVLLPASLFVL